jgi:hypothetical protein
MPKKGTILTPEQKVRKAITDKKYNERNKEKRREWARAQYRKDKALGKRHGTRPITITQGEFVVAFD